MRHGEALQGADDSKRPLSQRGKEESAAVARYLLQNGAKVDIFYQSTKQRAKETAQIVKDILNPQAAVQTKSGLAPNDPVENILPELNAGNKNLMIVSHLPFLGKLVSRLVTGQEEDGIVPMPTASVVILKDSAQGLWNIKGIVAPEDI